MRDAGWSPTWVVISSAALSADHFHAALPLFNERTFRPPANLRTSSSSTQPMKQPARRIGGG
jgi:hypothetical protein